VKASSISSKLLLDKLTRAQQDRLISLLDDYMIGLETNKPLDIELLCAEHPELASTLREYAKGLDWLGRFPNAAASVRAWRGSEAFLPAFMEHAVFGEYEIQEEIGRGAMGVVFAATKFSTGEEIAIKILAMDASGDSRAAERFRREAEAARSLDHPHIVKVLDIGVERGLHFYTMERINGLPLSTWIRSVEGLGFKPVTDKGLPLPGLPGEGPGVRGVQAAYESMAYPKPTFDASTIVASPDAASPLTVVDYRRLATDFAGLADALSTAHAAGIIHRDIKPSNILVDRNRRFLITDFGLAHIEQQRTLTLTGDLIGTFAYMSPEQAAGKPDRIDARTDIYSLGATLFETLVGRSPFSDISGAALLQRIQTSQPPALRSIDPRIPRDLETIVARSMCSDKADRYVDATALANDLKRFAAGEHPLAKPVTLLERAGRSIARRPQYALAGLAMCGICIAALLIHGLILGVEQNKTKFALELAEKNYRSARSVVDSLASGFVDRLSAVPGTEAVRKEMLAESLAYYEAFITDSINDPRLVDDVAATRLKIARLYEQNGHSEEADGMYHEAVETLQASWSTQHAHRTLVDLYHAWHEWSMLAQRRGKNAEAEQRLKSASALIDFFPNGLDVAMARVLLENNQAILAMQQGDRVAAKKHAESAVELSSKLCVADDATREYSALTEPLADALSNLGAVLSESGDFERASAAARAAVGLREMNSGQESADQLRRLALAYNNLAAADWRQTKSDEAVDSYRRAIELLERSMAKQSGRIETQRELSVTLNNWGLALASLKKDQEAEAAFRRALNVASPAADADPKNADAARRTAGIWNNLGVLFRNRYDFATARKAFIQAKAYQERSCKLAPDDKTGAAILEQIQSNLVTLTSAKRS
jgi:serine/threonine protein kinase/Tfp pilus assembly protein PilF